MKKLTVFVVFLFVVGNIFAETDIEKEDRMIKTYYNDLFKEFLSDKNPSITNKIYQERIAFDLLYMKDLAMIQLNANGYFKNNQKLQDKASQFVFEVLVNYIKNNVVHPDTFEFVEVIDFVRERDFTETTTMYKLTLKDNAKRDWDILLLLEKGKPNKNFCFFAK